MDRRATPRTVETVAELAAAIRQRRLEQDWTQQQLAEKIGCSRKWVIDLEQGKTTVELLPVLDAISVLGLEITLSVKAETAHAPNPFPGSARRRPPNRPI
ncbi:helix-turn-helix domain-containing protein [Corynebacterium cystitidis]|uniref:helix-turn-helix domain-containing protein n=1 Tax=Corynebacterium cystitidis TaxID=35757 RepID=UPI000B89391E|nr:helix-turn-helix domain-containing protein [Corynebacterium cystitidis]